MLKNQGIIQKVTIIVYVLILITSIILSYILMTSSNFPISEIGIKGEYENVNRSQINLIKDKFIKKKFFCGESTRNKISIQEASLDKGC